MPAAPDPSQAVLLQTLGQPLPLLPVQAQAAAAVNTGDNEIGGQPGCSTAPAEAGGSAQQEIALGRTAAATAANLASRVPELPGKDAAESLAVSASAHHAIPAPLTKAFGTIPSSTAQPLTAPVRESVTKAGPGTAVLEKQAPGSQTQASPQIQPPSAHSAPSKTQSDAGDRQTAAQASGTGGETPSGNSSGGNANTQPQASPPSVPVTPVASGPDSGPAAMPLPAFAAEVTVSTGASSTAAQSQPASPGAHLGEADRADPLNAVNSAQLISRATGTEMRVGLHSDEFGSISIATSVSRGNVVAQIALDHGELSRALLSHVPGMEEKLGAALGLHARVELRDAAQASTQGNAYNSGAQNSASGGTGSGASPGQGQSTQTVLPYKTISESGSGTEAEAAAAQDTASGGVRLNLHV